MAYINNATTVIYNVVRAYAKAIVAVLSAATAGVCCTAIALSPPVMLG